MQIKTGDILKGPFWPEKIKVISFKALNDTLLKLEAVGIDSRNFYNSVLSNEDIKSIEIQPETQLSFNANAEHLFLYLESHRIRNAFQFDPLYAVNVSQIDPLLTKLKLFISTYCKTHASDSSSLMTLGQEKQLWLVSF
jgi:hypothetical protein